MTTLFKKSPSDLSKVISDNAGLEMVRSIVSEQLSDYQEKIIIEEAQDG